MSEDQRDMLTTPVGVAKYCHITTPDTRFNEDGEYKVDLVLNMDDKDAADFVENITNITTQVGPKANIPVEPELDDDGNPTGNYIAKFRSKFQPKVFDSHNNPINVTKENDADGFPREDFVRVGFGTTMRIATRPKAYKVGSTSGVKLYLQAVQVHTLVTPPISGGSSWGFTSEEAPEDDALPL